MATCFCWRDGRIEFGRRAPRNSLRLARGSLRQLREAACAIARHAYDGRTLLVPGLPEASSDVEALAAAVDFRERLKVRMSAPDQVDQP